MKSNRALITILATTVLATTVLATTIAFVVTQIPLLDQQAVAQNATASTTNQTAGNQTQGGGPMANLTQADFEPVRDNLNTARESLQTNDTTAAYDAMNTAGSELFGLANDQGEQNMEAVMQQFKPIQDSIGSIRDTLRNGDAANALQQLNTADEELFKLTQQLPPEEDGEGE